MEHHEQVSALSVIQQYAAMPPWSILTKCTIAIELYMSPLRLSPSGVSKLVRISSTFGLPCFAEYDGPVGSSVLPQLLCVDIPNRWVAWTGDLRACVIGGLSLVTSVYSSVSCFRRGQHRKTLSKMEITPSEFH